MNSSKSPLYMQIKKYLEDQIHLGIYKPHDQLPSESELAKQFNVSRITSKNAILQLVEDEKVYRIAGKGTFVEELKLNKTIGGQNQQFGTNQTKSIGLIMPEVVERHSAQILAGIESVLTSLGYTLILRQSHHSIEEENKAIEMMLQNNVKGLIIFPVDDQIYNEEILRLTLDNFPLVLIDRYLKGIETAAVYSDNFQGAYQLTKTLLAQKHQKIGLFTAPNFETITVEDRIKGFEQALDDAYIPIQRSTWFTDILQEKPVDKAVAFLLENPDITGIFAMNAYAGKIAFQAANILQKKIPKDFAIASFDQDRELDIYPIYTAKQNSSRIGRKAVELIQAQINNKETEKQIILPVEICLHLPESE